jgi:hypothetical protein
MGRELQGAGFYLAGLLCLVLAALKLMLALPWSWWRVLVPLWGGAGAQCRVHCGRVHLANMDG